MKPATKPVASLKHKADKRAHIPSGRSSAGAMTAGSIS